MPVYGTPTNQIAILEAVVSRLQSEVPQLQGDNTCFMSMSVEPSSEQRQTLYATVSPMGGRYDDGIFVGSGDVNELTGVVITVWSAMKLDRPNGDKYMMTDATRGLLTLKQDILRAMIKKGPLMDSNGNIIISKPMQPINAGHPQRADDALGAFSLSFSTDFVWDL